MEHVDPLQERLTSMYDILTYTLCMFASRIYGHCVCGLGVPLHLPLTGTHYPAPPTTTTIAITILRLLAFTHHHIQSCSPHIFMGPPYNH